MTISIKSITVDQVITTYRGKTGCACGCGGEYVTPEENARAVNNRVSFINENINDSRLVVDTYKDEIIYELENLEGTRVTRVYVQA